MPLPTVYATESCVECELQAAGRCPTCHHSCCLDHFALDAHEPCASRLAGEAATRVCYVCAAPVLPQQWSTTSFTHYVDAQRCAGCGRWVCPTSHTRQREEQVKIVHEGMRSNRYHVTVRYCDLCAPLRRLGGLVGATWWSVSMLSVAAAAFYLFHR